MTDPALRLTVNYAATDGTMPESVDIEWAGKPDGDHFIRILSVLMAAPARRATAYAEEVRTNGGEAPDQVHCRRLLCGHPLDVHAVGGTRYCLACGSQDQCRSFVGAAPNDDIPEGGKQ